MIMMMMMIIIIIVTRPRLCLLVCFIKGGTRGGLVQIWFTASPFLSLSLSPFSRSRNFYVFLRFQIVAREFCPFLVKQSVCTSGLSTAHKNT